MYKRQEQGKVNGARDLRLIDKEELHRLVPAVVGEFAMFSPNSGIVDPFKYTIALAENAAQNGVEYFFDHEVTDIHYNGEEIYAVSYTHLCRRRSGRRFVHPPAVCGGCPSLRSRVKRLRPGGRNPRRRG